ncbi:hypothetical protein [Hwangdonia lutea]|uniref:Lipoprotein n=1 Tax=Hwangdonia lutea TaxID=3075823 RepID=A0AA97HSM7_9FLAO|nr:hypothetical protein [Hwangdonia sp. SCSIO 19198]WOD45285.1 hypothetical protein RNZ46_08430 [Hwangdonia sp. SCSIO 19198]
MKTKALTIVLILITTISCKNETKTEAMSGVDNLELTLNNGEKWIANVETDKGVKSMDSIIAVFKKEKDKDYNTLGENLSKQTSYIIKNCTMEGESHDQLHVVLVPMLDEISALKESNNTANPEASLVNLEQLIDAYFSHFKL